jgi:excisionase family DNA binding protein
MSPNPTPSMSSDGFATVKEAADFLNVSVGLVYRLTESGKLPSVRIGSSIRIPRRVLVEMATPSLPVA